MKFGRYRYVNGIHCSRLAGIAVASLLASCTSLTFAVNNTAPPPAAHARLTEWLAPACDRAAFASSVPLGGELDPARIRMLIWNTQKHFAADTRADLFRIFGAADLFLLQEAVLRDEFLNLFAADSYHSFAAGFDGFGDTTGVLTVSRVRPVYSCSLQHAEPWLRSPKATSMTRFALAGTDTELLVVNIHMVNFALGLGDMREQLNATLNFIARHNGPVVVSGDFNTWRGGRTTLVETALNEVGLSAVTFPADVRKRFLGQPLDHLYVRGMRPVFSTTYEAESSDHNPLAVTLRIEACTACSEERI